MCCLIKYSKNKRKCTDDTIHIVVNILFYFEQKKIQNCTHLLSHHLIYFYSHFLSIVFHFQQKILKIKKKCFKSFFLFIFNFVAIFFILNKKTI